jgi:hypothetical protein
MSRWKEQLAACCLARQAFYFSGRKMWPKFAAKQIFPDTAVNYSARIVFIDTLLQE